MNSLIENFSWEIDCTSPIVDTNYGPWKAFSDIVCDYNEEEGQEPLASVRMWFITKLKALDTKSPRGRFIPIPPDVRNSLKGVLLNYLLDVSRYANGLSAKSKWDDWCRGRKTGLEVGTRSANQAGIQEEINAGQMTKKEPESALATYDKATTKTIEDRWRTLVADRLALDSWIGQVVIDVRLHSDGQITDLKIVQPIGPETLTLLCEKAIRDPAPFEAWSHEMRRQVGEDESYRDMRFTFYYAGQRLRIGTKIKAQP